MTEGDILATADLSMVFGGLVALSEVNLRLKRDAITALIGPNGAGKTTLFNCLTSIYRPTRGQILFRPDPAESEINLGRLKPNQVTAKGMARTFQNIRLFNNLTVLENVLVGRHTCLKAGIWGAVFRGRNTRLEEQEAVSRCYNLLERYQLAGQAGQLAGSLPYGAQRRLEIVRALATEPALILLDEPAAGLNIGETRELENLINRLKTEEKVTVLLIEHDMNLVMSVSETVYVMEYGRILARGAPEAVRADPAVIKAYLGED